ncbi:hypothetical protein [Tropicimonas sp. IMCC34043]|uniref:hypothetical protein n=1 Tax=Tropicimonas sp. IMCC34043 TaxID=2248760 RepID=UPI000E255492|nr:hypothetical protein [Tropicimonas sp. IMCC34043]
MSPLLVASTLSMFATCYAIVLAVIWIRAVGRRDRHEHVGLFIALMGVLVPGVVLSIATLLAGAVFGLPYIGLALPVLFPAAIATGLHLEVDALTSPTPSTEGFRIAQGVVLTIILVALT